MLSIRTIKSSKQPSKEQGQMEIPMEAALPCKLKTTKSSYRHRATDSETNKLQKIKACMHRRSSRVYKKAFGTDSIKRSRRSHCGTRGSTRRVITILCTNSSHGASGENPGCETSSGQRMGEARKVVALANDQSKEQKRGYSGSTKREKITVFATLMDICHLKNAEFGPQCDQMYNKAGLCSEVTL